MSDATFGPIADYLAAFADGDLPFVHVYTFDDAAGYAYRCCSRGEFLLLARRLAGALREAGVQPREHIALCMGANQLGDLALRLGAALTGIVPVTINWQADNLERILYKVRLTSAKALIVDDRFPSDTLALLRTELPQLPVLDLVDMEATEPLPEDKICRDLQDDSTRIVIFTSGTTGEPKGVQLSFGNYAANRLTFEQFLAVDPDDRFAVLLVNPLHHTNSTAISDWAMRRPGSELHLVERYSTRYWQILTEVAERGYDRLVAPAVARHFDFLENLEAKGSLPVESRRLREAMKRTDFLIGSAPVGPTTVKRLQAYTGSVPIVRFGSTETCLQVMGIPHELPEAAKLAAFEAGWAHQVGGVAQPGFYIGRPHRPYTDVRIVHSINRESSQYKVDCTPGEAGYLITRGDNVMTGYVRNGEATSDVFDDGDYLGLRDIGFALRSEYDGELDYYWMSRDSALLIRGGANYAYDQINGELSGFVEAHFGLPRDRFDLAVVGLKVDSEHEDACCVTLEFQESVSRQIRHRIEREFLTEAASEVSKGAKPDYLRIAAIPRNFKGAILVPELRAGFSDFLSQQKAVDS